MITFAFVIDFPDLLLIASITNHFRLDNQKAHLN
jgi:hypothetical protein